MNQSLVVQNFGPIKKIEIKITDFLILIGEQATGKSTIAKLVYFFKSLRTDLIEYLYNEQEIENLLDQNFLFKIRQKFSPNFFGTTKHLQSFEIQYHYRNNRFLEISLNSSQKINISFKNNKTNEDKKKDKTYKDLLKICEKITDFRKEYFTKNNALLSSKDYREINFYKKEARKQIENDINLFFGDDKDTFFIPAGRSLIATLSEQLQTIDTYQLDFLMKIFLQSIQRLKKGFSLSFEEIIEEAKLNQKNIPDNIFLNIALEKIVSILKGRYHFDSLGDKIFYDSENFVKLNFASSGQQEVVWILQQLFLFILNKDKIFLIIEEPEAHLYPIAQKKLIELITLFINLTDSQIIVTTHSPYILSSFNNLIFAKNVGKSKENQANQIIQKEIWIDFDKISTFKIDNGEIFNINDQELKLVRIEEIDHASTLINNDFDNLFELQDQ